MPHVPTTFPVQPVKPGDNPTDPVTCETCNLTWDDAIVTEWTPAPSGRCPFEYFHPTTVNRDNLNDVMSFDHVIRVNGDLTVDDYRVSARAGVYAPELYDGELQTTRDEPWTLMNGYSQQQGYSGPLMHQSESIGGTMADDILSEPGYYVALANYDDDDDGPTEWAVARRDL